MLIFPPVFPQSFYKAVLPQKISAVKKTLPLLGSYTFRVTIWCYFPTKNNHKVSVLSILRKNILAERLCNVTDILMCVDGWVISFTPSHPHRYFKFNECAYTASTDFLCTTELKTHG